MYTIDVLREIGRNNPIIDYFRFVKYNVPRDIIKDNVWTEHEEKLFENALELRACTHIPFWESLMLTQINKEYFSTEILKKTNFHNNITTFRLIKPQNLGSGFTTLPCIGINSRLLCKSDCIMHLPMLDFRVPVSSHNTSIAIEICKQLEYNGYLLNSGRSYHFIGTKPISHCDLNTFLGKALLYSPIVDTTWIAHQLIDGTATLRIGSKYGMEPELITRIMI